MNFITRNKRIVWKLDHLDKKREIREKFAKGIEKRVLIEEFNSSIVNSAISSLLDLIERDLKQDLTPKQIILDLESKGIAISFSNLKFLRQKVEKRKEKREKKGKLSFIKK